MNDVNLDNGLFVMLKGEPGTRKSTQALSFPLPQYWFSFDRKMKALIRPMKDWGIDPAKISYDDYSTWNLTLDSSRKSPHAKLTELELNCPYATIVWDSITLTGDAINLETVKTKSGTTTKSGEEKGSRVGTINVNTWEDYKAENQAFAEIMQSLGNIQFFNPKVNIVVIAHVIGERQESVITAHARTIITGGKQISGKISAKMEEVYHFDIEQSLNADKPGKFRAITFHTGEDFARTILPLPPVMDIDNKPLYGTYIKPAIEQLKALQTVKGL